MKRLRLFAAVCAATTLGIGVTAAAADAAILPPPPSNTCQNSYLYGGTYTSLTVVGWCAIDGESTVTVKNQLTVSSGSQLYVDPYSTLNVKGNVVQLDSSTFQTYFYSTTTIGTTSYAGSLSLGSNASFFADSYGESVHIFGGLTAANNAFVALGCTYAHPCENAEFNKTNSVEQAPQLNSVVINGDVSLNQVLNATIDGAKLKGNVTITNSGTTQYDADPNGGYMPIKDNTIGGNLTVSGFHGNWFGVIRNLIRGSALIVNNNGDSDSTEVVSNQVNGNLACAGNTPPAQFGDALEGPGYGANTVGGAALGECAALTVNPSQPVG